MENRVKIIGNGGREDAIRWKLEQHGHMVVDDLARMTIVGPETDLVNGIVDRHGLKNIVGPSRLAARLEGSKLYAKQFMQRHDIPTARWMTYTRNGEGMNQCLFDLENMRDYRPEDHYPVVLKEDGLCGGKGVVVCKTKEEAWSNIPHMFISNIYKSPSNKILVEDFVEGVEASCFVLVDYNSYKILPYCKDYKRAYDNNYGPNTGGMGAISPVPYITDKVKKLVEERIIKPTIHGMRRDGAVYRGVLYIGLMIKNGEPYVIEYNVRFGDPECQILMMLLEDDLYPYLEATYKDTLDKLPDPKIYDGAAVTVTLCSKGYPKDYVTGLVINGLDTVPKDVEVFRAGVQEKDGHYLTSSGRVLNVTARAKTLEEARQKVYSAIGENGVNFDSMHYRTDIGELNEKSGNNNTFETRNKRRSGRSNTELCRKRFKNHSHFRRADISSRS